MTEPAARASRPALWFGYDVVAVRAGLVIWASTIIVGLVLRRFAFDRGTATAFVIVTIVTLGLLMLGWRLVRTQTTRHIRQSEGSP